VGNEPNGTTTDRPPSATSALISLWIGVAISLSAPCLMGTEVSTVTISGGTVVTTPTQTLNAWDDEPVAWAAVAVALVVIPLWFWWWRRAGMSFGRGIGLLASIATAAVVAVLTLYSPFLVAAPVAYFAAFWLAPPPRTAEDVADVGR
jgi:hypothetical protein